MGPECACGCGEFLPEGSTREYKRGHRARAKEAEREESVADSDVIVDDENSPLLTLESLARETPPDPDPIEPIGGKRPKVSVRVSKKVRDDIEGKIAFYLSLAGTGFAMADPICAQVFQAQTPEIASKLTPILCQSPDVVKWFTKSSNFFLWVDLAMAAYPVLQIIAQHHLLKTIGYEQMMERPDGVTPDFVDYPV